MKSNRYDKMSDEELTVFFDFVFGLFLGDGIWMKLVGNVCVLL
ncbi:hypothetical protein RCH33_2087 [Flavobacterium daejeonense]|nr:hypothetical protein RCH33_2087 [Flavobacterium daejeonense]